MRYIIDNLEVTEEDFHEALSGQLLLYGNSWQHTAINTPEYGPEIVVRLLDYKELEKNVSRAKMVMRNVRP